METWKSGATIAVARFEEMVKDGDSYLETVEKKAKENEEGYEEPQNEGEAEGDEVGWLGWMAYCSTR